MLETVFTLAPSLMSITFFVFALRSLRGSDSLRACTHTSVGWEYAFPASFRNIIPVTTPCIESPQACASVRPSHVLLSTSPSQRIIIEAGDRPHAGVCIVDRRPVLEHCWWWLEVICPRGATRCQGCEYNYTLWEQTDGGRAAKGTGWQAIYSRSLIVSGWVAGAQVERQWLVDEWLALKKRGLGWFVDFVWTDYLIHVLRPVVWLKTCVYILRAILGYYNSDLVAVVDISLRDERLLLFVFGESTFNFNSCFKALAWDVLRHATNFFFFNSECGEKIQYNQIKSILFI